MHQFDEEEIVEMFISALTTSFDPHSSYFSPTTYENFMIQMRLNLEGIGASLQSEDGLTVVKRIVPGGAAAKEGSLKVEDKIVSVGQGPDGEMEDIADMKLDDVVKQIRGKAGTIVRLGVMPAGTNEIKTYRITREKIELKDSEAQGKVMEYGSKKDGTPYRIGVINLPSFYSDMEGARLGSLDFKSSTRDTQKLLEQFKKEGVDAVVVDLRANGGGSLPEAIDLTGLFIDRGPVVQVKDSIGIVREHDDNVPGMSWDGPLVVVTSKFSASASEILAGAIKDYERGIVVGDKATHGKGTVQSLINVHQFLTNSPRPKLTMGALKVTMQQFYRPGGRSTQKKGVEADVVLPSISDVMDVGEDDLEFALEFDQVQSSEFPLLRMTDPAMIKQLDEKSLARRSKSEDFAKALRDIKRYVEQKDKSTVTLNEEKFLAQRKEFDAEKQDEKAIEDQVNPAEDLIKRDYYLEEVLAIAADYVEELRVKGIAKLN
jgi:carboxyl-terminal processing protease